MAAQPGETAVSVGTTYLDCLMDEIASGWNGGNIEMVRAGATTGERRRGGEDMFRYRLSRRGKRYELRITRDHFTDEVHVVDRPTLEIAIWKMSSGERSKSSESGQSSAT